MRAYKFLRDGGLGPFSGFRWPLPGADGPGPWIEARAFAGRCGAGIHACDGDHLTYWLGPELWIIELGGDVVAADRKLVAPRGRLVARVDAWGPAIVDELAGAAIERARGLVAAAAAGPDAALARGYLDDAILFRSLDAAASLFCAAHAALTEAGLAAERRWQSRWLATRLGVLPLAT